MRLPLPNVVGMTEQLPPVLWMRNVDRWYGDGPSAVPALTDISLDIAPSQFTAIMGPSGSGKSTLLNIAAGLDNPSKGQVWLAGQPFHELSDDRRTQLRRDHIGFVFQAFNLVPTLTVRENILLPFDLAARTPSQQDRERIDYLTQTLGLKERITHRPAELSGGQQQRVAIARALAVRPHLVIADEPTGNLDTRTSREVLALLRAAAQEHQQTILMVTHDPVAASYADRILVVADGRIAGDYPAMPATEIARLMVNLEVGAA